MSDSQREQRKNEHVEIAMSQKDAQIESTGETDLEKFPDGNVGLSPVVYIKTGDRSVI